MTEKHTCPWPGCEEEVRPHFWGCLAHWNLLPQNFRWNFIRAMKYASSEAVAKVGAGIQEWVLAQASAIPTTQESTSTPTLSAAFSSGVTSEGDMFLFWPNSGEYLVIPRAEIRTVIAGARLALEWEGEKE